MTKQNRQKSNSKKIKNCFNVISENRRTAKTGDGMITLRITCRIKKTCVIKVCLVLMYEYSRFDDF